MTVLYDYFRSSAAYRLRIGLGLLGLSWRSVPIDLLKAEHKAAQNLARNPQGLVPTLEIDGLSLTQSLAILEYLNETRDAGWLPGDAAGRARVRALAHVIAMDIHPICNVSVARFAVERSGGGLSLEAWMAEFIPRGLAPFEALLARPGTGRCCHGDAPGLADICLAPQLYNARRWGVDLAPYPLIRAIDARLAELPAFAAAHPDKHQPKVTP